MKRYIIFWSHVVSECNQMINHYNNMNSPQPWDKANKRTYVIKMEYAIKRLQTACETFKS